MSTKSHRENVYDTKPAQKASWYQPRAALSLAMIQRCGYSSGASVIDVGGGASTLPSCCIRDARPSGRSASI